jgi:hemerythrin-like domain-containing protein
MPDSDERTAPLKAPGPDADAPTDFLAEIFGFHQHIRRAVAELRELAASRELAKHQREQARNLVQFFTGPFLEHDLDEEAILLPRLRARTTRPEHLEALRLVSEDHDRMEGELEEIVTCLREIDHGSLLQLRALDRLVKRFEQTIEPHLLMEEHKLFPLARTCLDHDELRGMQSEWEKRSKLRKSGVRAAVPLIASKRGKK